MWAYSDSSLLLCLGGPVVFLWFLDGFSHHVFEEAVLLIGRVDSHNVLAVFPLMADQFRYLVESDGNPGMSMGYQRCNA